MATFQENVGKPIPAVKVSWILLQQKMSLWCHYVSCDDDGSDKWQPELWRQKFQLYHHHLPTNTQFFYSPDALLVA